MPAALDTAPRKKRVKKKAPVKMVPRGPGGQNLRPAPKVKVKPRTNAQKEQGKKVIYKAAHVKAGPPSPPKIGKTGGGKFTKKKSGAEQFTAGALSLFKGGTPASALSQAVIKNPKKSLKTAGKIVENTGRSAIDIPANIVPSAVYLGEPIYKNPGKPKSYTKTAKRLGEGAVSLPKEFIKDPGGTVVKNPLEIGLMAAPIPRLPGIARGGVARRKGNMPRSKPRELPETKMKVVDAPSKSYYKENRRSKKPTGQVKDQDIERRVDEQVALMEDLARRAQSTTYKKTYKDRKKVVGRKEASLEAAGLAKIEQKKVRDEHRANIYEGMAIQQKPKVKLTHPKAVSPKQTALKNQIVNLSEAVGQAKKNLDIEKKHLAEGQKLRQDLLGKGKSVAPIQNRLADSAQRVKNRESEVMQLETSLRKVDEQHAKEVLRKGPIAVHQVSPGGKAKEYTASDAFLAAERYNAKNKVKMEPVYINGKYKVVPESAVKRLKQHEADVEVGPVGAAARTYNTLWRKNVLATHPTWYAGNIIEAAMRSVVGGVGPTAYVRGYKALGELKRTDPKAYAEATAHISKGGHLAMQAHLPDENKIDIVGHGFLADTARKIQAQRNNPKGPKQVADVWTNFTDFTMGTLSGKAESFFQTGMLGKELARSPLMDGHTLKTSKSAIADAAKGLRETHNQVALGQAVDRMYGQYGKWSPGKRKMIANYTPFIAWTLNSLNFLGRVMPVDHPVLTAAVASSQPYVDEWLKDKGLSAFVKGALPPFLQGSIPAEKGHARFPTRYTPMALAAGFPEPIGNALLPQLSNVQDLLVHDINWKGEKVNNPDGSPLDPIQKMVLGALYLLEGAVPASQQTFGPGENYEEGARVEPKLVKPKPPGEIAQNLLNPFKLVPKQKESKKKKNDLDSIIGGGTKSGGESKSNTLDSIINASP